jgi:hypothetical protein
MSNPTPSVNASYSAYSVYQTVPQFIQNNDAQNGYPLWNYIYGICKSIDAVNVLSRDAIGAGVYVYPSNSTYGAYTFTYAGLNKAIATTDTSLKIFGTDSTWSQINTASSFSITIESEQILVPAGSYNWQAPVVTFTGVTRGYNGTTATSHAASSGADGRIDITNYNGAPGWSQILDINRCPDFALPWLAQFVGATLSQNSGLTRQQMIQKITQRAGFNRGTVASMIAELVTLINQSNPSQQITANQILFLENCKPGATYGQYTYSQYSITILIPSQYITSYTYSGFNTALNAYQANATYNSGSKNVTTFINLTNSTYAFFDASSLPSALSNYVNFLYRYRPAGVEVFIGGY